MQQTILFIGHDATRTGAPQSLLKIVRWFKSNTAFNIIVILNRAGPLRSDYEKVAKTFVWFEQKRFFRRFLLLQRIFLKIHRQRLLKSVLDSSPICIFNNTGVNGDLVQLIKTRTNAPVVSRIPELEGFMRRNALGGSVQKILGLSTRIVAVSEAVRRNLNVRYQVPLDKMSVAYGACDIDPITAPPGTLRNRIGALPSDTIICGCGTMDWRKGYDLFVQVARKILTGLNRLDVHFVWIGSAVSSHTRVEFEYEIELLGLQKYFHHLGELENPSQVFAECDAFFLSSREDPFPLVMLEATRQALPIICFEGSGGATEFVDAEIGTIVPMADIDAAVIALLAIADDRETGKRKGLAASQRSAKFTVERMCTDVHQVVLAAIAAHRL